MTPKTFDAFIIFIREVTVAFDKVAEMGVGADLSKVNSAREDLSRCLYFESRQAQPFPTEKVCYYCNWTNTGLLNIGKPNEPKWICHTCVARIVNQAEAQDPLPPPQPQDRYAKIKPL